MRTVWLMVVLVVSIASNPSAVRADSTAVGADFGGEWITTFGPMTLRVRGEAVDGTYVMGGMTCTISGTQRGSVLDFRYVEPWPGAPIEGEGSFELAPGGSTFAGRWRPAAGAAGNAVAWETWMGRRLVAADPAASAPADPAPSNGWSGVWDTTYGAMRLDVHGDRVVGRYALGGGSTIEGRVVGETGDRLEIRYAEPDGVTGSATFEITEDRSRFSGTWRQDRPAGVAPNVPEPRAQSWLGTRVPPAPGKVWLVVLEAHWESSVREHEYAYGHMLRAFFTRLPQVEFRHRFVHDAPDFARFCGELTYIAEPVYLYISSHGVPEGIACGGAILGPEELARCLAHVGDVRLLHLGGCLMMAGDMPARVAAALPPHVSRFPISGFTQPADWAGSAIVDFTYLDAILGRGLPPSIAAQAVRDTVIFARQPDPNVASFIAPMGLTVFMPPASPPSPQGR